VSRVDGTEQERSPVELVVEADEAGLRLDVVLVRLGSQVSGKSG
jgi:hypothetical protein